MKENNIEKIIRKVQGLIKLANDNKDDAEAKSALLMAQRLMMKHKIEQSQIDEALRQDESEMISYNAVLPKKMKWFEKDLAIVIADNFRVKMYYSVGFNGTRGVVFFGYKEDCELAKEIYDIALGAVNSHAKEHVELFYIFEGRYEKRTAKLTSMVRDSYIKGFIVGLAENFKAQTTEIVEEYGLTVLTPVEVNEAFEDMKKGFSKARAHKRPSNIHRGSFEQGIEDGKQLDSAPRIKIEG